MGQEFHSLEEVFRNTLSGKAETPSPEVLRRLKKRLRRADFFSLNPRKINIVYTTLLVGGLSAFGIFTFPGINNPNASSKAEVAVLTEESEERTDAIAEKENIVETKRKETGNKPAAEALFAAGFDVARSKGCAPLEVHFTDRSVRAESYHWDFGNGKTSSLPNPTIIYKEPGNYRAILTVTNSSGNKASFRKEIEVLKKPEAAFDIDLEGSKVDNRKVVFVNNSDGATKYTWHFGDNNETTKHSPEHIYNDYGVYNVQLVAEAQNGCTDTAQLVNKFIEKDYSFSFPLNFRPNPYDRGNNGYYERAGGEAGIFYPLNNGAKEYNLSIYTPNGIKVFSTTNIKQGWNGYIKGRMAPPGIYRYEATGVYPNRQPFSIKGQVKVIVEEYY
jgi:PKD repeat protein